MEANKSIIILFLAGTAVVAATYAAYPFLRSIQPMVMPAFNDVTTQGNNMGLSLPAGFSISVFARDLSDPRVLVKDPNGVLLVSVPKQGKVIAMPDRNNDGVSDESVVVVENLNLPHGMAFRCDSESCRIYIAETNQVAVYDYDRENLKAMNKRKIIDLPGGAQHFTRTITFKDGKLLISIGSSCNVCNESDWRRAKILSANEDGSNLEVWASGLRNAVFMKDHSGTGKLWVTEMGRDMLGDDIPPDEVNIAEQGNSYGWPICYGKNVHDIDFDRNIYIRNPCQEPFEKPSHIDIPAHSAPLGLAFFQESWPEEYGHDLLVAFHGSWNRTEPTGYKIVRYILDSSGNVTGGPQDFISGWYKDGTAWGRPVDIMIESDRKMYISDDKAGVIYLVTYNQ